ncbi:methyltransferase domain-containing protein [Paenibacillus sp. CC-CFT747]|nr:methyltransferase domain-containing protein [Paenibacillus sp. CC-CFT747]
MEYLEMLSRLGLGSAHPGGFSESVEQFTKFPLAADSSILEVGCGTGRTACYLAEQGYRVTAVDLHPQMVVKAKRRAEQLGVTVEFRQADAHALPFDDQSFDALLVESVTNFTQAPVSVAEYYRVLKPGGVLYNREMFVKPSATTEILKDIQEFFGMPQILTQPQWTDLMTASGFERIEMLEVQEITDEKLEKQHDQPDQYQWMDEGVILDFSLLECGIRSSQLISENREHLEYGIMRAFKGGEE